MHWLLPNSWRTSGPTRPCVTRSYPRIRSTSWPTGRWVGDLESCLRTSVPKATREAVGITDSLVRFSIGIEHIDDLIGDIRQAWNA
mgnify:CR=1 FL=1